LENSQSVIGKVITLDNPIGLIALLGSGETSLNGGRIFETIAQRLSRPVHIAILETPAGFELNSAQVAGRVGEYLKSRLENFDPIIEVVPARKRGTPFSPENEDVLKPLLQANIIFMGPGSPTYTVRELSGSLAWGLVRARHRLGATLVFSSAAAIAIGDYALPVYEIYKVGEDVSAVPGLGLFADFGLSLSFIPHWNNTDGGAEVDTSRCFVGKDRFSLWRDMLPSGQTIIGLDEHTGLFVDLNAGKCTVNGINSVTLMRGGDLEIQPTGKVFQVEELGHFYQPKFPEEGIPGVAWEMINNDIEAHQTDEVPVEVLRLVEERLQARIRKDWDTADALRQKIAILGWVVMDAPEGQKMVKQQ
jgi:cyanophycinase-like exopeptidase